MRSFWFDLKVAIRGLLKERRFALVIVSSFALGVGASVTIYGAVHAVLLAPLGFADEQRLVAVSSVQPAEALEVRGNFLPDFWFWRERAESFDEVAFFGWRSWTLTEGDRVERVESVAVSANVFRMLGMEPALGRNFVPEDEGPGPADVVIVSHGLWQRVWGGDPEIVGKAFQLDGAPVTILGVMPADAAFPSARAELFRPVGYLERYEQSPYGREERDFEVIGHLGPGVTLERARSEMRTLSQALGESFPATNAGWSARVTPLREHIAGNARVPLLVAFAAVGIVFLMACTNIANVLLVRAMGRQRETAVRRALGAGGGRLLQQHVAESLVLTLVGGLAGVALASWLTWLLLSFEPGLLPRVETVGIGAAGLRFALVLSLATGLVFAAVSVLHRAPSLSGALRQGSGHIGSGREGQRLRMALVAGQMAMALALVVGAGLLGRALHDLSRVDPGFRPEGVYASHIILGGRYRQDNEARRTYFKGLVDEVRRLPGVSAAALSTTPPIPGMGIQIEVPFRGTEGPLVTESDAPRAAFRVIGPRYFETIGTPLMRGRDFTETDTADTPPVVILNDTLAKLAFPGADAVGRGLDVYMFDERHRMEVVGVSADTRFAGLDQPARPALFLVHPQMPFLGMGVVARTTLGPATYGEMIRRAVLAQDPAHPVLRVESLEEALAGSLALERFYAVLLGLFAACALALAGSGIYGVFSFWVSQRGREMGLRLALGATRSDVKRLILARGLTVIGPGVVSGLVLALGVSRGLAGTFRGVAPMDPFVLVAASALLATVALAACWVPATVAAKVPPTVALRSD